MDDMPLPLGANAREIVAIRGVSNGSRLAVYQTLSININSIIWSALLGVARVFRVWACIRFYFMGSQRVSASYVYFSSLMLSLETCSCSSVIFLSSRPRTGLATTFITGY